MLSKILCEYKIFFVYSALETQIVILFYFYFFHSHTFFLYQLSWQTLLIYLSLSLTNLWAKVISVWKFKITNLLLREDMLDFVEISTIVALGQKEQYAKRKNKTLTIIKPYDKIIPYVQHLPKNIWIILSNLYVVKIVSRKLLIKSKLTNLKMEEDIPMEFFLESITDLLN